MSTDTSRVSMDIQSQPKPFDIITYIVIDPVTLFNRIIECIK